jgi:hypothetical protein
MSTSAPIATLDYGAQPSARRRALRLARRIFLWTVAAAVLFAGWRWGRSGIEHAALLSRQSKMLRFAPPSQTIAFTNIPDDCDELFAAKTHASVDLQFTGTYPPERDKNAGFIPPLADELFALAGTVGVNPRGTVVQSGRRAGMPLGPPPTLFLHARRAAPTAPEQLVHVFATLQWSSVEAAEIGFPIDTAIRATRGADDVRINVAQLKLSGAVFNPASWRLDSSMRPTGLRLSDSAVFIPHRALRDPLTGAVDIYQRSLRIWVGTLDPRDESRFCLRYELDGEAGVIEGQLRAPGLFHWAVASGPLRLIGDESRIVPTKKP